MAHLILHLSTQAAEGFLQYIFARNKIPIGTNNVPQAIKKTKWVAVTLLHLLQLASAH